MRSWRAASLKMSIGLSSLSFSRATQRSMRRRKNHRTDGNRKFDRKDVTAKAKISNKSQSGIGMVWVMAPECHRRKRGANPPPAAMQRIDSCQNLLLCSARRKKITKPIQDRRAGPDDADAKRPTLAVSHLCGPFHRCGVERVVSRQSGQGANWLIGRLRSAHPDGL